MERKFFNPFADTTVANNRLPHWHQPGATYFLTLRLADSLPANLLCAWNADRDAWFKFNPEPWSPAQEREYHNRFTVLLERWLDEGHGQCLLRRPEVRTAVQSVLTKFDHARYWHHALVLMPNHAHLLFSLNAQTALSDLLRAWKGASSRATTIALGKTKADDAFWQKDYHDRLIRDADHFWNCIHYIRRNPIKAKLPPSDYTLLFSKEIQATLAQD